MRRNEKFSHLMLFCGLLLVRRSEFTLRDVGGLLPLDGNAKQLMQELANPAPALQASTGPSDPELILDPPAGASIHSVTSNLTLPAQFFSPMDPRTPLPCPVAF